MKTIFRTLILALCTSYALQASHVPPGEITWECVGNNQYIFYYDEYLECTGISMNVALSKTIVRNQPGMQVDLTIQLALYDTVDVTLDCNGPTGGGCYSSSLMGRVMLARYKSNVITFSSTPPATGWVFHYYICCGRPAVNTTGTNGLGNAQAKMYPSMSGCHTSPRFVSNPTQQITRANRSVSCLAVSDNPEDSLYYRFSSTYASWDLGFSDTRPFPSDSSDSRNGPMHLNGHSGLISVNASYGISGEYFYSVTVEQWRNHQLLSEIFRSNFIVVDFSDTINVAPSLAIDTSMFNVTRSGKTYKAYPEVGDSLIFDIAATDAGFNTGSQSAQMITFSAQGMALDSSWGAQNSFINKASITPIAPQIGFSDSIQNSVQFIWVIAPEHFRRNNSIYHFHFKAADDQCPYVGVSNIVLEVHLRESVRIDQDTIFICAGDSVQLNGASSSLNYLWSPSLSISADSIATPTVWPSTSGYYYLTDPANLSLRDSVYISVSQQGTFNLGFNGGQLTLTDSANTTTRVWYYNGIPFSYPYDTLSPFGLGDYYVVAKSGGCQYISDTVSITSGSVLSMTEPGNGFYDTLSISSAGSIGVTFKLNYAAQVNYLSLPGIVDMAGKANQYDFNLKVYDTDSFLEIFNKDIVLNQPVNGLLKIDISGLPLQANTRYTIGISGDTGFAFSLIKYMQYPATPYNVGLDVWTNGYGPHRQFPLSAIPGIYTLPISLGIDRTVSLSEISESIWSIYPNPAKEQIQIVGMNGGESVELMDMSGKLVRTVKLAEDQTEITVSRNDVPSGLYFIKVQFENSTSVKKVLFE